VQLPPLQADILESPLYSGFI